MPKVTLIPARKQIGSKTEQVPKLRVAAYCRVSTDSDEQATSYEAQIEHYTNYITTHPGWELAGIYADGGISGTNTKKREEFNRMITDCMNGCIDMVITKSISRFARNTLDCLTYIRQLKEKNIPVFFEKENINTLDARGEVCLTIMASLAQQESLSLSQNVRIGLEYRYQQGKVQVCTNRFLGYDKDANGNLIINPKEAEIVRRIYNEYLEGKSYYEIAKGLRADGLKTAAGKDVWAATTLRKILSNEKYIGDALLQKTVTTDFLKKERKTNKGLAPQYYVENNHEAIIPRHIYMLVQEEMVRRANLETKTGKRRVYSGKFALSSIMYCAHCGDIYQRTHWLVHDEDVIVWRCTSRLRKKSSGIECPARTLKETELHAAVIKAVNQVMENKYELLKEARERIEKENKIRGSHIELMAELERKLEDLQRQLLKKANAKQGFNELVDKIDEVREEKQKILLEKATNTGTLQQIKEIEKFFDENAEGVKDYSEGLVRKLIEKITVYDDHLHFEFKSGIQTDVMM